MKLAELEQKARAEEAAAIEAAWQEEETEQAAHEEACEAFRQQVIAWMVEQGDLDAEELQEVLGVVDLNGYFLELQLPDHQVIGFRLLKTDEGFAVQGKEFLIEHPYNVDSFRRRYSLGTALMAAAELYQEVAEYEADRERREAEWEAEVERGKQEAAERGQRYLDMLEDHPILRPMLDMLAIFLEEREHLAEDVEMAERFAASTAASLTEKLEQARYDAERAERERDDLQHELWDAQETLQRRG